MTERREAEERHWHTDRRTNIQTGEHHPLTKHWLQCAFLNGTWDASDKTERDVHSLGFSNTEAREEVEGKLVGGWLVD